uniref:Putative DNA binding, helix-turn-helix domain containing protein n=1 Tax=viral metagenome TaxID=1070528 RepID=A0A6H1ZKC7_9ZZZZ
MERDLLERENYRLKHELAAAKSGARGLELSNMTLKAKTEALKSSLIAAASAHCPSLVNLESLCPDLGMDLMRLDQAFRRALIRPVDDVERDQLVYVVLECEGNLSEASEVLGISRQAIQKRIKKHDLEGFLEEVREGGNGVHYYPFGRAWPTGKRVGGDSGTGV